MNSGPTYENNVTENPISEPLLGFWTLVIRPCSQSLNKEGDPGNPSMSHYVGNLSTPYPNFQLSSQTMYPDMDRNNPRQGCSKEADYILQRNLLLGLERWCSRSEYWLLLKESMSLQAPTTTLTSVSEELAPSSGLYGYCTHMVQQFITHSFYPFLLSLVFIYFKFIFSQNWDNTFNKYNYLSTNSIPEELVSVVRFLYCLKISGYSWSIVFFYIHIKVITTEIIHILIIPTFLSSNYQHILYKMYRFYFPFDPLYLWCHT